MNDDYKSFCTAIVLSILVIMGVNHLFPQENVKPEIAEAIEVVTQDETQEAMAEENSVEENDIEAVVALSANEALAQDERIELKNKDISGSIRLKGARFDNILLSKYKQTIEEGSPDVELMSPAKTEHPFYAEYGWLSTDKNLVLPKSDTIWQVLGNEELTPETPVTLVWDNEQGVRFTYLISLDENYLFNIRQTIENNTDHEIVLYPYGLFSKSIDPEKVGNTVVHEGFTGILDGKLKEIKYAKIDEDADTYETTGGWVSFSDKYWFAAFVFNDAYKTKVSVRKVKDNLFQLDYKGLPLKIQAGSATSVDSRLFAGAKEIKLLDSYSKDIKKFDLNVDFGWYYFITKPFFYILDFLYNYIGNMGWAILLFAAILRLFMFPIANKSYENMSKMKKVQPKLLMLQEIYKDDKMALQRATMDLYKREKVNPAAGCLPMFIQIPIFFSLYKVLNIAIEIRHAPFIGWIKDLSAPDPLTISTWSHIYIPSMLDIGVWPIIYGVTMFIQNKLNPKPANKDQARMFAMMPIIFTIMFAHFAVGLVIYWTLSNILSLIQQKLIMYKNGVK